MVDNAFSKKHVSSSELKKILRNICLMRQYFAPIEMEEEFFIILDESNYEGPLTEPFVDASTLRGFCYFIKKTDFCSCIFGNGISSEDEAVCNEFKLWFEKTVNNTKDDKSIFGLLLNMLLFYLGENLKSRPDYHGTYRKRSSYPILSMEPGFSEKAEKAKKKYGIPQKTLTEEEEWGNMEKNLDYIEEAAGVDVYKKRCDTCFDITECDIEGNTEKYTGKVGLFFYFGEKNNSCIDYKGILFHSLKLVEAPSYGDFLTDSEGHSEFFEKNFPDAGCEYFDIPRGRVVYNLITDEYTIYVDKCLKKKKIISEIKKAFNLTEKCTVELDEHYVCPKCHRNLVIFN